MTLVDVCCIVSIVRLCKFLGPSFFFSLFVVQGRFVSTHRLHGLVDSHFIFRMAQASQARGVKLPLLRAAEALDTLEDAFELGGSGPIATSVWCVLQVPIAHPPTLLSWIGVMWNSLGFSGTRRIRGQNFGNGVLKLKCAEELVMEMLHVLVLPENVTGYLYL